MTDFIQGEDRTQSTLFPERLDDKLAKLKEQMQRPKRLEVQMLATPEQQLSLTDPDSRSMATSGRGTGMVGYNVQTAVDTKYHLIVEHEVTNLGHDRTQLCNMAMRTKEVLEVEALDVVADRGYYRGEEILDCENAGLTVYLPKGSGQNEFAIWGVETPGPAKARGARIVALFKRRATQTVRMDRRSRW